jgi:hypothetical protein
MPKPRLLARRAVSITSYDEGMSRTISPSPASPVNRVETTFALGEGQGGSPLQRLVKPGDNEAIGEALAAEGNESRVLVTSLREVL